jgi:hypothetical protein
MINIFWTGYSNDERHTSINNINSVVARYGELVDFKLFSDISITMKIEIEECKIDDLYVELAAIVGMDTFEKLHSMSAKERTIYLNITFKKATGNLVIEVPAVQG